MNFYLICFLFVCHLTSTIKIMNNVMKMWEHVRYWILSKDPFYCAVVLNLFDFHVTISLKYSTSFLFSVFDSDDYKFAVFVFCFSKV